jgi:asparagine synthase (glutamine-hydrolysing)
MNNMCGITGWIDWQADLAGEHKIIGAMSDQLYNRGPDTEGMWLSKHAALGHRRLIVVDPSGGDQPMTRSKGNRTYTMVYNGELYNTDEIRSQLKARGYRFRSHSDTEVLLTSYMEWGADCLPKLNGIFAFAIWCEEEEKLFIARDRLGVKPLFYYQKGSTLLFASEVKSILTHPDVEVEVDAEGLSEILVMAPARTPGHGIFRGIKELIPGEYLVYDRERLINRKYWSLKSFPHEDNLEDTIQNVRNLFIDSVTRQLVSDVPICTFLSGGLDSSLISAVAAKASKENGWGPLHTYSVDYVDNDKYFKVNEYQPNPDAPWVQRVSEELGTIHHAIFIDTPHLVQALKNAVQLRDFPGMADVDSSLYLFCKEIKKGATVALSGECADEVFGGYPWFHRQELWSDQAFPWTRNMNHKFSFFSDQVLNDLKPFEYMAMRYQEALAEVPRLPGEKEEDAKIREMFYLNLTRWMPILLDRKDRMSMGTGLEVRVPFCDHRLVEYVWNIPWQIKKYGDREKGLLRQAMKGILSDEVIMRKKSPYPKTHNPAYLEAVKSWVLEIVEDAASPILPLVNVNVIKEFAARSDLETLHMPWFGQLMNVPALFAYLAQVNQWLLDYKVKLV